MHIYSEAFKLVVYIPEDAKTECNAERVSIWLIPGFERIGENDQFGIDNEFNSK